jgi:pimeloyl-ACP methyl ester carboxylesterase
VLVIQGARDELVKPELTQKFVARLNGNTEYIEVDAEHNPAQPEHTCWQEVASHIQQFTQKQQPQTMGT